MRLDAETILFVSLTSAVVIAVVLAVATRGGEARRVAQRWIAGLLMGAMGVLLILLNERVSGLLPSGLASALILGGVVTAWSGVRLFNGKEAAMGPILMASAVWMIFLLVPYLSASFEVRSAITSLVVAVLCLAIALELWRGGPDRLRHRNPLAIIAVGHAAVQAVHAGLSVLDRGSVDDLMQVGTFHAAFLVVPLLTAISAGLFGMLLLGERQEAGLRRLALLDPLTQVLNRRGFCERAAYLASAARADGRSLAFLLFDLDRFKQFNDNHGHAAGDRVLIAFVKVVRKCLRADDLFGRVGGEEFAVVLANVDEEAASRIAERVRRTFHEEDVFVGDKVFRAAVSVGVATRAGRDIDLMEMFAAADSALYLAKRQARSHSRRMASAKGCAGG